MNDHIKLELSQHIEALYPILYLVTYEERQADELIRELAEDRKVYEWNMSGGRVDFKTKQPQADYYDLATALDVFLKDELDNHFIVIKDAHLALGDTPQGGFSPVAIARLKALADKIIEDGNTNATVFLVSSQAVVPRELEKHITLFDLPLPDEPQTREMIGEFSENYGVTLDTKTVDALTMAFRGLSRQEIGFLLNRGYQRDGAINMDDVALVLAAKEQTIKKSGTLEMVPEKEKLEDIGGLEALKTWLKRKAAILKDLTDAREFGVDAPKGVMIVGMPGCGKSLAAKSAAALFELPLLRLDVGSLMGKYVGESEGNMRRALRLADAVSPCVLWIDELEKAFAGINGGNGSGSEVASRLFGSFLTWMQEKTDAVFVIATANDISALPPELMRKGRFDEIFYVNFPTEEERKAIFTVHLKKRGKLSDKIDVGQLAKKTNGFSGADIESVVKEAIELAYVDGKKSLDIGRLVSVIDHTHPLKVVLKDKVAEYEKKFANLKIKPAS